MTAPKSYSGINLVPKDEFENSLVGKILRWSLSTGRMIVILTEFVVILAFLSRFKLDRDLNDINEVITQKQAIVGSFSDIEMQMRDIQTRMKILKTIQTTSVNSQKSFTTLINLTPRDVFYDTIEFNRDSWRFTGLAGSETSFASLLDQLENLKIFAKIQVGDVQYNLRRGGTTFNISAYYPVKATSITPSAGVPTSTTPAAGAEKL